MTHLPRLLPAVLASLLVSGCASDYWSRRLRDLGDCARGRLSLGVGLLADAELTSLIHPAVGFIDATLEPRFSVGWDPRDRKPGGTRTAAMPTLLVGWPFYGYHEARTGYAETKPYLRGLVAPWILMGNDHVQSTSHSLFLLHRLIPNPRLQSDESVAPAPTLGDRTWLATSATILVVRGDVGFNPLEFVDFLTGWFGIDLIGDDDREIEPGGSPEKVIAAARRPEPDAPR